MDGEKCSALEKIEAAKKMAANKDYAGARAKLLEAHYQFPGLKIVGQMITVCDILCTSELSLDGETDWYWVLQLSPQTNNTQIRLKYNKLVSLLEGIKDEFPGSITALKLVHDAYIVLSNPCKTWIFNSKRLTSRDACESFISTVSSLGDMSLSQEHDSSLVCESSASKDANAAEGLVGVDETSFTPIIIDDSDDDNQRNKGITSTELNFVSSSFKLEVTQTTDNNVANFNLSNVRATTSHLSDEHNSINFDGTMKAVSFEAGQIWAAYDNEKFPRRYARINSISESPFQINVTWLRPVPQNENERKWCEVNLPVVCGLFNLYEDEICLVESVFSHVVSCTASPTYDEFEIIPQEDEVWAVYKDWRPFDWLHNPESKKGCRLQIVRILEGYSEQEGMLVVPLVKVDGLHNIYKRENEVGQERYFKIPREFLYRFSHQLQTRDLEGGKLIGVFGDINSSTSQRPVSIVDSSLKLEWIANDFAESQVWAVYDDSDQMPRQYALVNKVYETGAIEVTFLEPHPNPMDNEEISWIEEKLPVGCGIFKIGSRIGIIPFSKFSHLVDCDRTAKNMFYRIYPKRGEIWAMYRNWNRKWRQRDFGEYHCRIVEITSDFAESSGLHTASLEEVPGYKTFFQKQLCDGFALNRVVPRSEMLSFSHRIEAFVVPGIEAHGIPECSWHLEPDALPPLVSNAA
ncbi:hypothetical protein SOVF_088420 [Spinacia oleracea]|uniref:DUF3444 domain-containing protein n=1 Tax=Spinacia oleracea TaxID=3562 RepID=A0A9R0HY21_SPIOL|nr:uncharacterized protein LOC110778858 [Spinacia oleracea]XP_056689694.1 uncharacterized protein LOC110778858 [Spinacia oleracea]XP_056689695.1 uncharacterized protein LOC110778858 [Spinacia oleracea]KNA16500.1 hypothetical protein SOVF_088420 [Spinacia oleracea]